MSRNKSKKAPEKAASPKAVTAPRSRRPLIIGISALLALALVVSLFAMNNNSPKPASFRVIRKIPHDPKAFTQGLLVHNGQLFESTGQFGTSSLRRIDLATGSIQQQLDLDADIFAEGLAFSKGVLVQLTWQSKKAFIYNDETFEKIGEYAYDTEGWGLTHDGQHFIMSDGSQRIYFRDDTFKIVRMIEVKDRGEFVTQLNELEYIDGEIWANVWQTWEIVRISPKTGEVLGRINLKGIVAGEDHNPQEDFLNGIAYDAANKAIYVTGKRYSYIYQIELAPAG